MFRNLYVKLDLFIIQINLIRELVLRAFSKSAIYYMPPIEIKEKDETNEMNEIKNNINYSLSVDLENIYKEDDTNIVLNSSDENTIKKKSIYKILNALKNNCINLSIYHNKRYHFYKNILFTFFRVPLILLSGFNSFFAVGMQNHTEQSTISTVNSIISLLCGIITSIELLWNLQKRMEIELDSHKSYYKLNIEIFKYMELDEDVKGTEAKLFLNIIYKNYEQQITSSNAVNVYRRGFIDQLEYIDGHPVELTMPIGQCSCFR